MDMQEPYRMSLMISFVQELKGLTEMNCGGCLSFIVMQEGGAMHGAEWMSVGNDGMVGMFSLHSIYYVLSRLFTRDGERTKLPIYLPLS